MKSTLLMLLAAATSTSAFARHLPVQNPDPAKYCIVNDPLEKPKIKCGSSSFYSGNSVVGAINVSVGCGIRLNVAEIGDHEYETWTTAQLFGGADGFAYTPGWWAIIPTLGESLAASGSIADIRVGGKAKQQVQNQLSKFSTCTNLVYPGDRPGLPAYVTASGEIYNLEPNAPQEMQPAYRDSHGLIWSKAVGLNMTFAQAKKLCAGISDGAITARLPTKFELLRLRESMSAKPDPNALITLDTETGFNFNRGENKTYDSSLPAFPGILHSQAEARSIDSSANNESIWSSSTTIITEENGAKAKPVEYVYELWGSSIIVMPHHWSPSLDSLFGFEKKMKTICVLDTAAQ